MIKGNVSKLSIPFGQVSTQLSPRSDGIGTDNYPVNVTELSGGGDGFNFAFGDMKDRKYTIEAVFVTEYDDYLLCHYRTERVYVAKPIMLRRVTYDGVTIGGVTYTYTAVNTRTASDGVGGEDDETQVITPTYIAGEKILAINMEDVINIQGAKTYWQEINSCRSWAVET